MSPLLLLRCPIVRDPLLVPTLFLCPPSSDAHPSTPLCSIPWLGAPLTTEMSPIKNYSVVICSPSITYEAHHSSEKRTNCSKCPLSPLIVWTKKSLSGPANTSQSNNLCKFESSTALQSGHLVIQVVSFKDFLKFMNSANRPWMKSSHWTWASLDYHLLRKGLKLCKVWYYMVGWVSWVANWCPGRLGVGLAGWVDWLGLQLHAHCTSNDWIAPPAWLMSCIFNPSAHVGCSPCSWMRFEL